MLISAYLLMSASLVTANPSRTELSKPPKNCQYLKQVATNQTHIRKSIDSIVGHNFDTDFAVPTGESSRSYKATMLPENIGNHGVTINLKYPVNSVSTAFRKNVEMTRKLYSLDFKSPTKAQPY